MIYEKLGKCVRMMTRGVHSHFADIVLNGYGSKKLHERLW